MWDQFNESYNMFTLALQTAKPTLTVNGYSELTLPKDTKPDLVIFGPFGTQWKELPAEWPKVHFTGENSPPIKDPSIKLNIGYSLPDISDTSYLRMPLWMFEIDWFGADPLQIKNPIPLPIDACTKSSADTYESRKKFCAFVVTNPKNPVRNQAYMTLNMYKPVDSAGRLFNTVGDVIFAGLGGGGGELKKHEFLKNYRFCLAYENESANGYTTEKILHAKAAGCIPIYWGDSKVGRDFDSKGFLNANDCKTPEDLIRLVDDVESNPEKWKTLASVPALSSYSRDLVRRTFSEMVKRFLTIGGRTDLVQSLPPFIGATTTEGSAELQKKREGIKDVKKVVSQSVTTPELVCVTSATKRFWPSLILWLQAIEKHRTTLTNIKSYIFIGDDVSDTTLNLTSEKYKDFATFIRFPTETPENFPDYWDPQHFAWKLWIYNHLNQMNELRGKVVLYTDAGSVMCRLPRQWIQTATQNEVCFLEDSRQTNRQWCHEVFCSTLKVTEEEKESKQLVGGLVCFVAGSPLATKVFNDCYTWSKQKDVIAGPKWAGVLPDGRPFGHRHDQSILSILSLRMNCKRLPLDHFYGDISARDTFHAGQSIYVHRGNYLTHRPMVPGIDDIYVINLERRSDRLKAFLEHHPFLKGYARRLPAYDGKQLTLTPSLARMFKPNDFFWKKAVMGCALSHMKLWTNLTNDSPEIQSFLILEDDARLQPGWQETWMKAYPSLPENWDCVYLGGILPPNRMGFANTLERIAPGLARVAPNQVFGQPSPTRYFHFCAYAYVLSRRGAEKILESILDRDGYWTSADHMVCNRVDAMNLYVLDPMMAGASQDNDPIYQKAEFNNFSRIDQFDSDLWNNDERFTPEEIKENLSKQRPLTISDTYQEVEASLVKRPVETSKPTKIVSTLISTDVPLKVVSTKPRFVVLDQCNVTNNSIYESNWLQDLFQTTPFVLESVKIEDPLEGSTNLIVVIIKNKWIEQINWLERLRANGHTFKILHLSDEHLNDPIHFYTWPEVKGVMRFYTRPDLPNDPKILIIPLGYHNQFKGGRDFPHIFTPELPFRDLTWSFAGTNWQGRQESMQILNVIQPSFVKWLDDWNSPKQMKEDEYISTMLSSKFIPCPSGQNRETYRFYEALTCGCIPIFINDPADSSWLDQFGGMLPFIKIDHWEHAAALMQHLIENKTILEQYRKAILFGWSEFLKVLKQKVTNFIKN